MRPLYDRVIVESDEPLKQTATGLYIPTEDKPQTGKVIAVGDGHVTQDGTLRPLTVQVGDTVLFARGMGYPLEFKGKEYLVFLESELLAIV